MGREEVHYKTATFTLKTRLTFNIDKSGVTRRNIEQEFRGAGQGEGDVDVDEDCLVFYSSDRNI